MYVQVRKIYIYSLLPQSQLHQHALLIQEAAAEVKANSDENGSKFSSD